MSMKESIAMVLKTQAEADEVCLARIHLICPTEIIAKHSWAYPRRMVVEQLLAATNSSTKVYSHNK